MIEWTDTLALGVAQIDKQHKEIFIRLKKLDEALDSNQSQEVLQEVVDFLSDYVVSHFRAEEDLMKEVGYPDYSPHKFEHSDFLDKFYQSRSFLATDTKSGKYYLHSVITSWLQQHILKTDQKLGAFLRAHGLPKE